MLSLQTESPARLQIMEKSDGFVARLPQNSGKLVSVVLATLKMIVDV